VILAQTSHQINGKTPGVLLLCQKRYRNLQNIYFNAYWAVWENGTGCESQFTVYLNAFTQSGVSSPTAFGDMCTRFSSDAVSDELHAPNTCGRSQAQFQYDVQSRVWYAPEPAGTYACP
jgi:hypothetical protein